MAEVLKKQRKIGGGHRAHVKKLLAQVEDSITNFEPSLQDKLLQQKIIPREKLDTLKNLDSKILELVDDENEDESIEHEVAEASKITDEITLAVHVVRIDLTLKSLQIILLSPQPKCFNWKCKLKSPIWTTLHGATAAFNIEIRAKLLKLEIKRFHCRPTEWQAFMDCFDSAVHSNLKLSNVDKMNYLVPRRRSSRSVNQRAALDIGKLQFR